MATFSIAAATHTLAIAGDTLFASIPVGGDIAAEIARVAAEIGGEIEISTDPADYLIVNAYQGGSYDEAADAFRASGTEPGDMVFTNGWAGTWIVGASA